MTKIDGFLQKIFLCGVRVVCVCAPQKESKKTCLSADLQTVDKAPSCEGAFLVS